jgi:hypothetical protein
VTTRVGLVGLVGDPSKFPALVFGFALMGLVSRACHSPFGGLSDDWVGLPCWGVPFEVERRLE